MTNRQISELPGFPNYSVVAKAYQRFTTKLEQDDILHETVESVTSGLSHVKT